MSCTPSYDLHITWGMGNPMCATFSVSLSWWDIQAACCLVITVVDSSAKDSWTGCCTLHRGGFL